MSQMRWADTIEVGVVPDASAFDRQFKADVAGAMRGIAREADRAAGLIEHSFKDAAADSDAALRKVGGPNTFKGIGAAAHREASKVSSEMKGLGASGTALFSGLGASIGSFAANGVASLLGLAKQAVTAGLQTAAGMEQSQIAFTELLGSAKEAHRFMKQLADFAASTPFELPGLVDATRGLIGAGLSAKEAMVAMKALGDASAALGLGQEQFGRVMIAVTQIMNKGKVSAEELMQMNEAGLPVQKMLASALGITTGELLKLGEQGKLNAEKVLPKLFDQMNKDYGGAMVKQSTTLAGLWSTFKDNINIAMSEGLQPLATMLRDKLPAAGQVLASWARDILPAALSTLMGAFSATQQLIATQVVPEFQSLQRTVEANTSGYAHLVEALGGSSGIWDAISFVVHRATEEVTGFGSQIVTVGNWIAERFSWFVEDGKTVLGAFGIELGKAAAASTTARTAAQDYTVALQAQKLAVQQLSGSLDSEHNAELNLRQAKLNVSSAQERLNTLKRQGKQGSTEYKQAEIDLERAQALLKVQTQDYNKAVDNTRTKERQAASASDSLAASQRQLKTDTIGAAKQAQTLGSSWEAAMKKLRDKKLDVTAKYNVGAPKGIELLIEKGLTHRAEGGGVWGPGSTTSDSIPTLLSDEEHVVAAREVRGLGGGSYTRGHAELAGMRRSWRGYATGGPVLSLHEPGRAGFLASPSAADQFLTNQLVASARGYAALVRENRDLIFGVAGAARGLAWARAHAGAPYLWGGVGPFGWDCSGWISSITNAIKGAATNRRLFSTASFSPGAGVAGFVPGLGPPGGFNIGVFRGNPGHMAGTLSGVNVESSGSRGTQVGGRARGATSGIFSMRFHLTNQAAPARPGKGDAPREGAATVGPGFRARMFDRGGWLWPGWNVVENRTGAPEHLTPDRGGAGGVTVNQYLTISPTAAQAPQLAAAMAAVGRAEALAAVGEYQRRAARGRRA